MEALLAAKTKLVTDYLMLAQQMNHTANSMTNYVSALAALPSHSDTVQHLVPIPQLPPAEPFAEYLNQLKGGTPGAGASSLAGDSSAAGSRAVKTEPGVAGEEEGPKKRGRKSTKEKPKKEKDPNAPKRPASAYIIFQNEMRPKLREANPDTPYKDILTKIADEWKNVPDDKKQSYNDEARQAMDEWRKLNSDYLAKKNGDTSPAAMPNTPAAHDNEDEEEEEDAPPAKKARADSESSSDEEDEDQDSSDDEEPAAPPKAVSPSKKASASPAKPASSGKKARK